MIRPLLLGLVLATASGCALHDTTAADAYPPARPIIPQDGQASTPTTRAPQSCLETVGENIILPEQRTIQYRDPAQFPPGPVPNSVPPRTVSHPHPEATEWQLSLDEAIRIALVNAQVVRVLAGTAAVSSGQTIYDPAISNTLIDQAQARFDPVFNHSSTFDRLDEPFAVLNPSNLSQAVITSTETQDYRATTGLTKTNVFGGQWSLTGTDTWTQFGSGGLFPLNPQNQSAVQVSYTQPLLQGGGYLVNLAPVVIARLNTEQSFFQYKDSVQELVRGVIEAYWLLVEARIGAWSAKIQVEQSQEAYERERARQGTGMADISNVAQARVTYNQFKAALVAADANVLTREGALRNILGLPPEDCRRIVPVSPPTSQRLEPHWDDLLRLAEQRRPDIVELKIITEADQVRLMQAHNQALPRLDVSSLYRWNGLSGTMPNREEIETEAGQFADWQIGINFSVPLGLRQGRALVRQSELTVARDRVNVVQGVHAAVHQLAETVRELDSAYDQYLAYKETRAAADVNVRVQNAKFRTGQAIYLVVLQALIDWGNAVNSEAQQLVNYNVALATLERQSGTILETHGLVFYEERYRAAGPLGLLHQDSLYPSDVPLTGQTHRYPGTGEPAENVFDLQKPAPRDRQEKEEELPRPRPLPPAKPE
jgi:outer membrane protein TolC